jgi:flagellar biogenesis protein FliO
MSANRHQFRVFLLIILSAIFFSDGIEAATSLTNNVGAETTELLRQDNDLFATGIKMFGAFAIVLAVFAGFVLAVKKWGHLATQTPANRELNVVEFRVLAHKTYLYVIEHQSERFLLSVGPTGTTLVSPKPAQPYSAGIPFPNDEFAILEQKETP